jgi:DNA-binding LacI/PurR family transcriptional regulator
VLCLVRIGDVEQSIEGHSRVFRERVLDGVIVTTSLPDRVARRIEELVPACVWADTNRWAATGCVRRDEAAAGRAAAQAAVDAGYAKLLFLTEETASGGVPDHYSHTERGRGVAAVCRRHDVPLETVRHDWHWTPQFAEQLVARLGPDVAVVATDAFRARIVQEAAAVHGRRIGSDFGLACCDTGGLTTATWPNLAGVTFDRVELGRRSAEMMLSLLETGRSPESVRLPGTWRPGATLRPQTG